MLGQMSQRGGAAGRTGDYISVPISNLRVNALLQTAIYDARPGLQHILLLAAGRVLTEAEIGALQRRGVTAVLVHPSEVNRITNDGTATPSSPPPARTVRRTPPPASSTTPDPKPAHQGFRLDRDSFLHRLQPPPELARNPVRAREFSRSFEENVGATAEIFEEFIEGGGVSTQRLERMSEGQLQEISLDFDEFLSRGVQPVAANYPNQHALQTAMLAESIGTIMGLRKDELLELGFGCMIHDAGMLLVPANLHQTDRPLQVSERLELQKHPIYAADLLNRTRNVPHGAKMVVYQMHERLNGTGYPRQRQGSQIHTLARIAAVADTYLAMVSPRTFRQGLPPYKAVEKLLFATRQGYFDPAAVRGLLHAVSLFPLGSMVQLSDGRTGRVVRGNRDRFAQPVVEIIEASNSSTEPELIDLSQRSDLQVVSTVGQPTEATPMADAPTGVS